MVFSSEALNRPIAAAATGAPGERWVGTRDPASEPDGAREDTFFFLCGPREAWLCWEAFGHLQFQDRREAPGLRALTLGSRRSLRVPLGSAPTAQSHPHGRHGRLGESASPAGPLAWEVGQCEWMKPAILSNETLSHYCSANRSFRGTSVGEAAVQLWGCTAGPVTRQGTVWTAGNRLESGGV